MGTHEAARALLHHCSMLQFPFVARILPPAYVKYERGQLLIATEPGYIGKLQTGHSSRHSPELSRTHILQFGPICLARARALLTARSGRGYVPFLQHRREPAFPCHQVLSLELCAT